MCIKFLLHDYQISCSQGSFCHCPLQLVEYCFSVMFISSFSIQIMAVRSSLIAVGQTAGLVSRKNSILQMNDSDIPHC